VADLEKISSSEYAIDGNLSRFAWMPVICKKETTMNVQAPLRPPYYPFSGWIAICAEADTNALEEKINLCLDSLIDGYGSSIFIKVRENFGFGFLIPRKYLPMSTWSFSEYEDTICFIEGVFYNDYYNYKIKDGNDAKFSEQILRKFLEGGLKSIDEISGSFSGFIYNTKYRRLISFVDKLGVKVLYWSYSNYDLILSSSMLSFRKLKNLSLDKSAVFQFMTIGFPIGERTLLDGVKIQPPASVIIFDGNNRRLEHYWKAPQRLKHMPPRDAAELINSSMEEFVGRIYGRTKSAIALGMTGGHDSRIIFSALQYRGIPFECIRWNEGDFNDRVVRELCSLAKKELIIVKPISSDAELLEIRKDVFIYSDGNYIYSSGFSRLAMESSKRHFSIIMTGFSGDRISGSLTVPAPGYMKSIEELACTALENQVEFLSFKDAISIIRCADDEMYQETISEWNRTFDAGSFENFEDLAIQQYINNRNLKRVRHQINPMLRYVQAIHPYSDNDVLQVYFSLPVDLIRHQKAHCYAGFYRNREYGKYQAVRYPISLNNEYKYPLSVYALRILKNYMDNSVLIRIAKKQKNNSSEWKKRVIKDLDTFDIINMDYLKDLYFRGLINQHILRKIHTLKIFHDAYLCGKDVAELLLNRSIR
jgi:asparagine synthetase B (glutamine-hydrolysing)